MSTYIPRVPRVQAYAWDGREAEAHNLAVRTGATGYRVEFLDEAGKATSYHGHTRTHLVLYGLTDSQALTLAEGDVVYRHEGEAQPWSTMDGEVFRKQWEVEPEPSLIGPPLSMAYGTIAKADHTTSAVPR